MPTTYQRSNSNGDCRLLPAASDDRLGLPTGKKEVCSTLLLRTLRAIEHKIHVNIHLVCSSDKEGTKETGGARELGLEVVSLESEVFLRELLRMEYGAGGGGGGEGKGGGEVNGDEKRGRRGGKDNKG